MTKEFNLRKDIENIDLKIKKLQLQRNILIMSFNSLSKNQSAVDSSSSQVDEPTSIHKSNSFGN
jgi:hypothetical protein